MQCSRMGSLSRRRSLACHNELLRKHRRYEEVRAQHRSGRLASPPAAEEHSRWASISEDEAMREEFPIRTQRVLAQRVGLRCSREGCAQPTAGPQVDPSKALNVGVAAHITAASPGGPRYDPTLTTSQRRSVQYGIWLCQTCAKLVDNDPGRYTVATLQS